MAAVRAAIIVTQYALTCVVDSYVKSFYKLYALLYFLFRPGYVQYEIAFFFGSNLRTIHIDYELSLIHI